MHSADAIGTACPERPQMSGDLASAAAIAYPAQAHHSEISLDDKLANLVQIGR